MARRCELTGKGVQVGNKVSHANNKTKTRFLPNLCNVNLISDAMGLSYNFRVSAIALKSVEHVLSLALPLVGALSRRLGRRSRCAGRAEKLSDHLLKDIGLSRSELLIRRLEGSGRCGRSCR